MKVTVRTNNAKPQMPKRGIRLPISGEVHVRLAHDFARFSNGAMAMTCTEGRFTDGEGKEVGFLRGDIGAPLLHFYFDERMWTLDANEIFAAVKRADEEYVASAERLP